MSFWVLLQILANIVLLGGFAIVWVRLNRPQKDDPRMSRGLQLLQSKIAVLEDLSDRTEVQVNQLTALLEQKCKDIQNKIFDAEDHIDQINQSIKKSMEVARIFQDKIPHKEIIERQNTVKFVKAAKLAHQGYSVDQIAAEVDLSRGEIEFIAKMNKDRLMVAEEALPDWARDEEDNLEEEASNFTSNSIRDLASIFEVPKTDNESLKKLGEEFRKACHSGVIEETSLKSHEKENLSFIENETELSTESSMTEISGEERSIIENFKSERSIIEKADNTPLKSRAEVSEKLQKEAKRQEDPPKSNVLSGSALERDISIRPVEFRKIDLSKDLG